MQNSSFNLRRRNLVLAAAGGATLAATPWAFAQQKFINVLTGGQSGVYYPMGVALSQIYGKALPDAKVTVQSTKASAENLNLLRPAAARSRSPWATPCRMPGRARRSPASTRRSKKLRAVAGIYRNFIQIVAIAALRHPHARRPEGQADFGRRAQVGHRAQRTRDPQGRGPDLRAISPRSSTSPSANRWS